MKKSDILFLGHIAQPSLCVCVCVCVCVSQCKHKITYNYYIIEQLLPQWHTLLFSHVSLLYCSVYVLFFMFYFTFPLPSLFLYFLVNV